MGPTTKKSNTMATSRKLPSRKKPPTTKKGGRKPTTTIKLTTNKDTIKPTTKQDTFDYENLSDYLKKVQGDPTDQSDDSFLVQGSTNHSHAHELKR